MSKRHAEAFRKLLSGRLAPELLPHLPGQPPQSGAYLDHVHRNADRRRRVGDRAGDRLADPPGRIGRELEAPAVVELVHALHQPDIALLDQVQELEAPVPVLLGDRDHEPQVGLDHLLLGLARLALRPQDCTGDPLELDRLQARVPGQRQDVLAQRDNLGTLLPGEGLPAFAAQPSDPRQPGRLQLAALMVREERVPRDAAIGGQAQKRAFAATQAAVQVAELVHERFDAGIGEMKALHRRREIALQLPAASGLPRRQRPVLAGQLDAQRLEPAELPIGHCDRVEGLHDTGKDLRLHGREHVRQRAGSMSASRRNRSRQWG